MRAMVQRGSLAESAPVWLPLGTNTIHCHGSVKCLKSSLIFGEHANDPTKGKCVCVCVSMLEGDVFKIPFRARQVEFSSLTHSMGAGRIEGRQKDDASFASFDIFTSPARV